MLLHGQHVGSLQRRDSFTKFVLDRDYWGRADRPVLGQWFEDHPRRQPHAVNHLPAWFSNLLPEGRLRELIAREQDVSTHQEIDLLARIGRDLPGAVEVVLDPEDQQSLGVRTELLHVVDQGGPGGRGDPVQPDLRFSLAGLALKLSMRWEEERLALPAHGQTGEWILKTPDTQYPDLPANEFAVMGLARAVGIAVPETRMVHRDQAPDLSDRFWPSHEGQAYAIRRFDRSPGGRVHMEDLAQVLGKSGAGEGKYQSTVQTVAGLAYRGRDHESLREMVRRATFNLLVGNGDAHLKNWSLIYPDRRRARLSPAYDLVCTAVYLPSPEDPDLGLPFLGARRLSQVTRDHCAELQRRLGVGKEDVLDVVDDTVQRFCDLWHTASQEAWAEGIPRPVVRWIDDHLRDTRARLGC
ncbi:type II toxin-antitoxin system HipA family toxin [Actinomyces sp. 2119]|uniref:type II toxin-antitoxin system HipA family toxin n=1 Tax=Actinomyces sp. 2119 TaxID=2321393 RepID=UPI0021757D9F|nr:HipA domain-containing protein [Actinomyces sp. 2119]